MSETPEVRNGQTPPGAELDLTRLLAQAREGDAEAANQALPHVYDHLYRVARAMLPRGGPEQTLGATALVSEAYLKLFGKGGKPWADRKHFFATAASALRCIATDDARSKNREKRRLPHGERIPEEMLPAIQRRSADEELALDDALTAFRRIDERAHQVAEVRLYLGLTCPQASQALEIPLRTVERDWAFADAWLTRKLAE